MQITFMSMILQLVLGIGSVGFMAVGVQNPMLPVVASLAYMGLAMLLIVNVKQ